MTSKRPAEDVASWVKETRIALGLSQTQLAEKLQVAHSTVNRWERGRTKPLPALMMQLEMLAKEAAGRGKTSRRKK